LAAVDTSQSNGLTPFTLAGSPEVPKRCDAPPPPKCPKEVPHPNPMSAKPPFKNPRFPPVVPVLKELIT
jgi:hypothetical protein